jgi:hypothetical protein
MSQILSYAFSAFVILIALVAAYLKLIPGDVLVAMLYGSGIGVGVVVGHGVATATQTKGTTS